MATLEQSIKMKNASVKGPALSGQAPMSTPDTPLKEGQSGGIAKSKSVKNAGSSSVKNPSNSPSSDFMKRMGVQTQSDKTVGYF